jgi:chemotaxis protein MotD
MMNVVNNALPVSTDVSTAASSASGKGSRTSKDDGFAKTLNSYGDGQSQRGKTGTAKDEDGAATSAPTDQDQATTDAAAPKAGAGGRPFSMTVDSMFSKPAAQATDAADPEAVLDMPVVEASETEQPAVIDGADVNTATDLLADLQAAIPNNAKGQAAPVRNPTTDQTKAGQASGDGADVADPDAADDALALLQALPDPQAAQAARSDAAADQQPMPIPSDDIDVDAVASQVGNSVQSLKDTTAVNTANADTGKPVQTGAAKVADATPFAHDALPHEDELSVDIDTPSVQVTENRRYIGIAPSSNAVSLATAFGQDPDWSAAMNPSARLSNEALYASTGKVVNTLKIELNPNDLGHVTATMRMVGEELNIHLTVESSKAYRQLMHDSSSMLDNLKAQGYSVDQITVSIASGSGSTSSDKGSDTFANSRQSSDMGQAQQQQQQNGRQGGSTSGNLTDTSDVGTRVSSSGGKDEGLAQGAGSGSAGTRPGTVYL